MGRLAMSSDTEGTGGSAAMSSYTEGAGGSAGDVVVH